MNTRIEGLSALVDGECTQEERQRILEQLGDDPELLDRWEKYHLLKAVVSEYGELLAVPDQSMTIRRSVGDVLSDVRRHVRETFDLVSVWTGGAAVAASVALTVLTGGFADLHPTSSGQWWQPGAAVTAQFGQPGGNVQWTSTAELSEKQQGMLNSAVLDHLQLASNGAFAYARVVAQ